MKSPRSVTILVCVWALLLAPGCSSSATQPSYPAPSSALSPFQWGVSTDGMVVMVPVGERFIYPATRLGGVRESIPLQIDVSIDALGQQRTVRLRDVLAPQEISPSAWRMELKRGSQWVAVQTYDFDGEQFQVPSMSGPVAFTSIRFVRR